MRKSALWIDLLVFLGWSSGASALPIEWTVASGGNGHSYELVAPGSTVTWSDARQDAESRGGYLATPTSAAESQWIYDTFSLNDYGSYWQTGGGTGPALGARWNVGSQTWEWVTGEAWDYENWRAGQALPIPENADWGMSYSTLEGVPIPSMLWQHVPVNGPLVHVSYVVEYPIPEPSTALLLGIGLSVLAATSRRRESPQTHTPAKP